MTQDDDGAEAFGSFGRDPLAATVAQQIIRLTNV
jgi:hypothetical protein